MKVIDILPFVHEIGIGFIPSNEILIQIQNFGSAVLSKKKYLTIKYFESGKCGTNAWVPHSLYFVNQSED